MANGNRPQGPDGTTEDDQFPCIWMSAGLVAYKLCDRGFDCENCFFDEAMRGVEPPSRSMRRDPPDTGPTLEFRDDRQYHRCHTWAQPREDGRTRVGLDGFAARLVGRASSVVFPALHTRLSQGRIACWLVDEAELIPLRSPVSGSVLVYNTVAQLDAALLSTRPYDEGWLLEVDLAESIGGSDPLLGAEAIRGQSSEQWEQLHERAHHELSEASASVGPTLPDGGERLTDLRQLLGAERHRRLILPFLS